MAGIVREAALVAALACHAHEALVAFAERCGDRPAGLPSASSSAARDRAASSTISRLESPPWAVARHVAAEAHAGPPPASGSAASPSAARRSIGASQSASPPTLSVTTKISAVNSWARRIGQAASWKVAVASSKLITPAAPRTAGRSGDGGGRRPTSRVIAVASQPAHLLGRSRGLAIGAPGGGAILGNAMIEQDWQAIGPFGAPAPLPLGRSAAHTTWRASRLGRRAELGLLDPRRGRLLLGVEAAEHVGRGRCRFAMSAQASGRVSDKVSAITFARRLRPSRTSMARLVLQDEGVRQQEVAARRQRRHERSATRRAHRDRRVVENFPSTRSSRALRNASSKRSRRRQSTLPWHGSAAGALQGGLGNVGGDDWPTRGASSSMNLPSEQASPLPCRFGLSGNRPSVRRYFSCS